MLTSKANCIGCAGTMQINEWERSIFDSMYDGILIADRHAIVKYINSGYTRITKISSEDIVGKPLGAIRPGSMLPQVIKSGQPRLGVRRKVAEYEYIVNMVPVIEDGEIVGGISILNEINDIYRLVSELDRSNRLIRKLSDRVSQLGQAKYTFDDIVCADPVSAESLRVAARIAEKDMNVLIAGESGTGKELYAQSIHNAGSRRNHPFIAINCSTLNSQLLESELFGYEDGAFTGARKGGKAGLFEAADGGTIFLDEISEMELKLQAKLLRTLQERMVRPIGSTRETPVAVRVIAATNVELESLILGNLFRKDLYYRIAVFVLNLAPLRMRRGDIGPLIAVCLDDIARKYKTRVIVSGEAMKRLHDYDWPGNVRELKNVIEYASMMIDGSVMDCDALPKKIKAGCAPAAESDAGSGHPAPDMKTLESIIDEAEASAIRSALDAFGTTVEAKKKAAAALGISLSSLYTKLKQYPHLSSMK